jgi:4-hydroxybenzoyl-CoA thioesterase
LIILSQKSPDWNRLGGQGGGRMAGRATDRVTDRVAPGIEIPHNPNHSGLDEEDPSMAFTSLQKIRFDDVDGAGIVYYPQFFHLCHKSFEDFFDDAASISYPELINGQRIGFPTVAIESQFTAPMRYGDIAVIKLEVRKIGTSSVEFGYEIRRKADAALCFTAVITCVHMAIETNTAVPIPDDMRHLLETLL